jgi:hypothetical protein
MKLVWHIVRKDLFRLRWILLLWAVVLIAALGLATIQSGLDEETYFPFWIAASVLVVGFLPLMAFGLVMGLLHDDPVAEIDAFWITRPISGGELLFAKLTALLVLASIPVLIAIPFWLNYDYGWSQIGQAAGQTLRMDFILVMLALPFAVISANASKFVTNVMVGAGILLVIVLLLSLGNSRVDKPGDSALLESKAWLIAGIWFLTVLVVTLNQFLRRRTRQSVAVLALAVAAGFGVAKWCPWKLNGPLPAPNESATAAAEVGRNAPVFSAVIAGETKRMVIMAEVPLAAGANSFLHGGMLKIQHVLLDYTGDLQISFTEAMPRLSGKFRDLLPGTALQQKKPGYYFITNLAEGGAFVVTPINDGYDLDVASLHFSHLTISARPEVTWQGKTAANLVTWLKAAVLVKVETPEAAPTHGVTTARKFLP